jgi:hypothetical protein
VKQSDPWGAAEATASKATVKFCITCREPFTRLYTNINGRPRLRDLKRWSAQRVLYCSRQCCATFRRNKRNAGWLTLPASLANLEPTPTLQPKMRSAARPGRPATNTGPEAIERTERAHAVMAQRLAGRTFREIALASGVSAATAHRLFWKVVSENPPSRRRQRAALEAGT